MNDVDGEYISQIKPSHP